MGSAPVRVGEIVVFNIKGRDIPIVHRVITVHDRAGGSGHQDVLTKGDNNFMDDKARPCRCVAHLSPILFPHFVFNFCQFLSPVPLLTRACVACAQMLYAVGQDWLHREHVMGRAVGYLPHVGQVTILMNDYPAIKFLLIGVLGLLVVVRQRAGGGGRRPPVAALIRPSPRASLPLAQTSKE